MRELTCPQLIMFDCYEKLSGVNDTVAGLQLPCHRCEGYSALQ